MNILDRRFKYVPAASTDIRKTFAKARRQMQQNEQERAVKVAPLPQRKARA